MLTSMSALSYEIALTRVFSISLWYHFAFMVISIAMLGIGLSGTVLSLYAGLKSEAKISVYMMLLAVSIPLSYVAANSIPFDPVRLSWDNAQILYICLYYAVLSVPFFFSGLVISTSFALFADKSGSVYGADLLGAGAGSVGILFLMGSAGPERAVFALGAAASLGGFLMGGRKAKAVSLAIAFACLFVFFRNPDFIAPRMSQYKGLRTALNYPGSRHIKTYMNGFSRVDVFGSPFVRFAPGLSLRYLGELPEQIGISVDGDNLSAITKAGPHEFLGFLPSALAYELGGRDDVLILEPKGGLQVLLAGHYGSKNIFKADSNPLIVEAINKDFREFSGGIYAENTWKGLGRSFLSGGSRTFDIIDISLFETTPSGHFGISEDYRFTVEAFKEYLSRLKPDGMLNLNLFIIPPPRVELRLLNTVLKAMEDSGMHALGGKIAAIRSWDAVCIMVKKSGFRASDIKKIRDFSRGKRFDLVYYEGINKEETNLYIKMPSYDYYEAVRNIINPGTRENLIKSYIFDISEVRDERPFFHYYLKAKNIREIYGVMGRKWQYFIEEGYLLPVVFVQALLISALFLCLPYLRGVAGSRFLDAFKSLSYFAFLGLGFMFTEIPLIQKMILPLENPSYAVAVVLASVLISSAAGSLLSERYALIRSRRVLIVISLLIVFYGFMLPSAIGKISPYPIGQKVFISFFMLLPLGVFMGVPFPTGIRSIAQGLIPWAWAVNGCFSVLSPIMAVMLATALGFKAVFMLGAGMYCAAFILMGRLSRPLQS